MLPKIKQKQRKTHCEFHWFMNYKKSTTTSMIWSVMFCGYATSDAPYY
jgi:hypothetical protein